jgi:hypothetical protein
VLLDDPRRAAVAVVSEPPDRAVFTIDAGAFGPDRRTADIRFVPNSSAKAGLVGSCWAALSRLLPLRPAAENPTSGRHPTRPAVDSRAWPRRHGARLRLLSGSSW